MEIMDVEKVLQLSFRSITLKKLLNRHYDLSLKAVKKYMAELALREQLLRAFQVNGRFILRGDLEIQYARLLRLKSILVPFLPKPSRRPRGYFFTLYLNFSIASEII
jgi:hypothetical protein